jgi:hypothetical protein
MNTSDEPIENPTPPNVRHVIVPDGKIGVFSTSFKEVNLLSVSKTSAIVLHFTVVFRPDVAKAKQEEVIKSLSSHGLNDSSSILFSEGSVPNSYEIFWSETKMMGDYIVELLEAKGLYKMSLVERPNTN